MDMFETMYAEKMVDAEFGGYRFFSIRELGCAENVWRVEDLDRNVLGHMRGRDGIEERFVPNNDNVASEDVVKAFHGWADRRFGNGS